MIGHRWVILSLNKVALVRIGRWEVEGKEVTAAFCLDHRLAVTVA
jgi:hypothetical protein